MSKNSIYLDLRTDRTEDFKFIHPEQVEVIVQDIDTFKNKIGTAHGYEIVIDERTPIEQLKKLYELSELMIEEELNTITGFGLWAWEDESELCCANATQIERYLDCEIKAYEKRMLKAERQQAPKKILYINLVDKTNSNTENTVTLHSLQGSTDYVRRAESVVVHVSGITKKLQNYILAYSLQGMEKIVLIHGQRIFVGYDKIENYISYVLTNRTIEYQSTRERKQVYSIIKEFHIPMEVVANIDDYINHELLSAYDITIGNTTLLCEKQDTYKPTDLQRKEWGIKDTDFAFTSNKAKATYKDFTTLKDKLIAYVTLQYYIDNGLTSIDYNESTTGNITRKHLNYCADVCGHAHPYQDNDDVQNFIDKERYYLRAY